MLGTNPPSHLIWDGFVPNRRKKAVYLMDASITYNLKLINTSTM